MVDEAIAIRSPGVGRSQFTLAGSFDCRDRRAFFGPPFDFTKGRMSGFTGRRFVIVALVRRRPSRGSGFPNVRAHRVARLRAHSREPAVSGVAVREVVVSLTRHARARESLASALPAPVGCSPQRHQRSSVPWSFCPGIIRAWPFASPAPRESGSRPGTRDRLRSPESVVKRDPTWDSSGRKAEMGPPPRVYSPEPRTACSSPTAERLRREHRRGRESASRAGMQRLQGGWQMPSTRRPPTDVQPGFTRDLVNRR